MDIARQTISDHRVIKEAITYLKNGLKSISAYKEMIEIEVEKIFGPVNSHMVLQFICPIIEYLDHYNRAHDSKEKQRFWGEKIAKLRASFRQSSWVAQPIHLRKAVFSEDHKQDKTKQWLDRRLGLRQAA